MKRLDFTDEDAPERYEILYDGVLNTQRGFQAPGETRVLVRVLDKLERLGVVAERNGSASFVLVPGGGLVDLEDMEYKLMGECYPSVKWTPRAVRKVTKAIEWFEAAPETPKISPELVK